MILGQALLKGRDEEDQFRLILELTGSPTEEEKQGMSVQAVRQLPVASPLPNDQNVPLSFSSPLPYQPNILNYPFPPLPSRIDQVLSSPGPFNNIEPSGASSPLFQHHFHSTDAPWLSRRQVSISCPSSSPSIPPSEFPAATPYYPLIFDPVPRGAWKGRHRA